MAKGKDTFGFSAEQVKLIKETVGKDAVNEAELHKYLYRASKLGLDPIDGGIHLLTRNQKNYDTGKWEKKNVIVIGIDGFRAVADMSGKLTGIKRGTMYNEKGQLTRAWAEVFRNDWDHPAYEEAPFREFCQAKDGRATGLWASKPETMLKKCAEAAAHRMAFASMLAGVYVEEEITEEIEKPAETPADRKDKKANGSKPDSGKSQQTGQPSDSKPSETQQTTTSKAKEDNQQPSQEDKSQQENKASATKNSQEIDQSGGSDAKPFNGELVALQDSMKKEDAEVWGVTAFDVKSDNTYLVVSQKEISVKANDQIKVEGQLKDNRIYATLIENLGKKEETKEENKEASDGTSLEIVLASIPTAGTRQGQNLVWARGQKGEESVIIAAYDENIEAFQKLNEGDNIKVTGEIEETQNGNIVHIKTLEKAAA